MKIKKISSILPMEEKIKGTENSFGSGKRYLPFKVEDSSSTRKNNPYNKQTKKVKGGVR